MNMQEEFFNFVQINDNIATSGQLNEHQIKLISKQDYCTVISLVPHTSQDALPEQGKIVATNFMTYVNIPVLHEDPQMDQLKLFCAVMDSLKQQKVWVHCVRNTRVAAFMYLYQRYHLGYSHDQARSPMFDKWTPDETWLDFMQEAADEMDTVALRHMHKQSKVA